MDIIKFLRDLVRRFGPGIWPLALSVIVIGAGVGGWLLNNRIATVQDQNALLQEENRLLREAAAQLQIGDDLEQAFDPAVQITSPQSDAIVPSVFDLSGVYADLPRDSGLRVFVRHGEDKGTFPQDPVVYLEEEKTWRTRVDIGNVQGEAVTVIAALVGKDGQALYSFYFKVGRATGRWVGLDSLTADVVELDLIRVVHQ